MIMRAKLLGLSVIVIVLLTIYIVNIDRLPPRTPFKVARLVSGLPVPNNVDVLEFKEEWVDFNGNGFSFIVLSLDRDEFNRLYEKSLDEGYKDLPITESIYGPLKDISLRKNKGRYKVVIENSETMSFKATMLSPDDNTIIVYIAIN